MYRISCFADEISPHLDEQLDVMERLNVRYLSLRSLENVNVLDLTDGQLREIAGALRARGMGVSSIGSPVGKTPISDDVNGCLDQTRRAVEIARLLDCRRVRVFSFYMEKDELDDRRGEVVSRLSRMCEIAAAAGVTLMHENEAGIYGERSERCADLLESVNHPALRAVFDASNFVAASEAPFDTSLPRVRDYVDYMHIKDSRRSDGVIVPAGEGDGQLSAILPVFAQRDMFLTLEPHLAVAGRMRGFTGAELFARAHAALTGLLRAANIAYA